MKKTQPVFPGLRVNLELKVSEIFNVVKKSQNMNLYLKACQSSFSRSGILMNIVKVV